eukprot:CAMPEP_0113940784 /NCGR_PEP_ID=MMETSP1339-20121228/6852_1 /TAXON_ID=94617 /ORGANISM="Fibrocapsa japonica" /LENGTH=171 /DNA_ID=CAMNT_0000944737 /DNA_START=66 /DNA_END=581 /DNA_ORIENTATION=- /assembly_acc=CAM_ASM_000762
MAECDYRVKQEGAPMLAPYMGKRLHKCPVKDFRLCLRGGQTKFEELCPSLSAELEGITQGAVVLQLVGDPDSLPPTEEQPEKEKVSPGPAEEAASTPDGAKVDLPLLYLVCWRGKSAQLNSLCNKHELAQMQQVLDSILGPVKEEANDDSSKKAAEQDEVCKDDAGTTENI